MKTKRKYFFMTQEVKLGEPYDYRTSVDGINYFFKGTNLDRETADKLVEVGALQAKDEKMEEPTLELMVNRIAKRAGYVKVTVYETLTKLERISKYHSLIILLKEFSNYFEETEPLNIKSGRFSVYALNASTGKVEPITVNDKECLKNIVWFKSSEDAHIAISKVKSLYDSVFEKKDVEE